MKKIISVLILLVYSAATIGATVHLHYCMDKFVGSSLYDSGQDGECGKCGMTEKKGGCCKDEQKQIKIDDDHQKSSAPNYLIPASSSASIITIYISHPSIQAIPDNLITPDSSPPILKERLYIYNRVFLV